MLDAIELIEPQAFLLRILETDESKTLAAVVVMAETRSTPPVELAERFANSQLVPAFGKAIVAKL